MNSDKIIKKDDPDYIPPGDGSKPVCRAFSSNDYICTLEFGHKGDHAAHDSSGVQVSRWEKSKEFEIEPRESDFLNDVEVVSVSSLGATEFASVVSHFSKRTLERIEFARIKDKYGFLFVFKDNELILIVPSADRPEGLDFHTRRNLEED